MGLSKLISLSVTLAFFGFRKWEFSVYSKANQKSEV